MYINNYNENTVESNEEIQGLVKDFRNIIKSNPLLITHRDQDNRTFTEMIITLEPDNYRKALVFMKETSDFILEILNEKSFEIVKQMIYNSYGLVLMHSYVFFNSNGSSLSIENSVTLKKYILDKNLKELIAHSEIFENNYLIKVYEFNSVIKFGELESVKKYLNSEENAFLLTSRDYSGRSCLHLAVLFGQRNIVS